MTSSSIAPAESIPFGTGSVRASVAGTRRRSWENGEYIQQKERTLAKRLTKLRGTIADVADLFVQVSRVCRAMGETESASCHGQHLHWRAPPAYGHDPHASPPTSACAGLFPSQGRSMEQVLWDRASRDVTLEDVEQVMKATNRPAYDAWMAARAALATEPSSVSLGGRSVGPAPQQEPEPPQGPDLDVDRDRVVLHAGPGGMAHTRVVLRNTGTTALAFEWRAEDPTPAGMPSTGEGCYATAG